MKKMLIMCVLFLLVVHQLFSQTNSKKITGKVTDENGAGLQSASVLLLGASKGVQSDVSGNFTIQVPDDGKTHSLTISYVGYASRVVAVSGSNLGTIKLNRQVSDADEVVVIGYQSVKKRDVLASVSSVSAKDLKDVPLNSAAEALAGRLTGVQVNVSEGAPGADVDVFVRGRNSITQSGAPLYIVDGVQVENALSVLSPQDIQTIDVLKDAASTAIYGARGSNGVFIITTKGGKNTQGKTNVTYNAFVGFNSISKKIDLMDPYNFVLYQYERAMYTGNATDTATAAQYIKRMNNYDTIARTYTNYANPVDWQDVTMGRHAFQTTHNISVSGGTAATQYSLSGTFNKQQGLLIKSDYDRKLLSFRFDHKASEKLKVGFNFRYNEQNITGAGTSDNGGAGSNFLRQYIRYRPLLLPGQTEDYYDPTLDANNPGNGLNMLNPLKMADAQYRLKKVAAYNMSGYINYSFNKSVSFRSTFGYDVNKAPTYGFDDTLLSNPRSYNRQPIVYLTTNDRFAINNSNVFTYSNPAFLNKKNTLDILVGEETYQTRNTTWSQETRYFPIGIDPEVAIANLGLASPPTGQIQPKASSSDVSTTQLSFFGRINYSYNRKYFLTANFRADGSSLFGPNYSSSIAPSDPTNRKWGYFPSISGAWRISQEKFMRGISTVINDAKIRISYGQAGNSRVTAYGYTTGYISPANAGYGINDALAYSLTLPSRLGNPNLTWESLVSSNLGFDLSFLQNRVSLTIDMYSNLTTNLLVDNKIPANTGYTTQYQNVGSVSNKGIEIQLTASVIKKKDFNWNTSFNISFTKNKIKSLGSQKQFTANTGWFSSTNNPDDYLVKVGEQIGTMYGLKVDGFYTVNDFDVSNYVNSTYNAMYPNLLYQYKLKAGSANPSAVLADLVAPGQIKFRDINGDGKISVDSDRTIIGHALPKFTGGFNQQFSYKNFDLTIFMNFSVGNDIFNANKLEFGSAYGVDQNMLAIMKDRWKYIDGNGTLIQKQIDANTVIGIAPDQLATVNANAKIWQPSRSTNGFLPMSFAVEDGSYLRISNVTLGYTLPRGIFGNSGISSLRVYGTINNLATITHYSGYDPDVSSRRTTALTPGVDYSAYPRGRTFIFGLNVTF